MLIGIKLTLHPFKISLQWIPQHKHYQFSLCSHRGPDPEFQICVCCFSHPAQIWPQVSSYLETGKLHFFPSRSIHPICRAQFVLEYDPDDVTEDVSSVPKNIFIRVGRWRRALQMFSAKDYGSITERPTTGFQLSCSQKRCRPAGAVRCQHPPFKLSFAPASPSCQFRFGVICIFYTFPQLKI